MALPTTPVPFHTGGRGAVRTRDKGFHRVVRRCDINRFVSITHGDSGAASSPFNFQVLRRFEAALNHGRTDPDEQMKLVPGTVRVTAREGLEDELVGNSFFPEL